jgi:hypothetical protein
MKLWAVQTFGGILMLLVAMIALSDRLNSELETRRPTSATAVDYP